MTLLVAMLIATIGACHAQIETVIDTDYDPTHMFDHSTGTLAYDARRGTLLATMPDFGVWSSTDGGATFKPTSVGIDPNSGSFINRISIQNDSEYVFIGTGGHGWSVYRSMDGGATFQAVELPRQPSSRRTHFSESRGIMWFAWDGILGYDGGKEWMTFSNPNGNKPQGYLILSGHSIAINDGAEWHEFDVMTKAWTPVDLPRNQDRDAIRNMQAIRLDDGRLLWAENGSLMVGTGTSGQKRSIDSVYLPGQGTRVPFKSFRIKVLDDHVFLVDSVGIVGRWDHDSITYLGRGADGSRFTLRAELLYQRLNGRDVLLVIYLTADTPELLYRIDAIDLHTTQLIRSVSSRFSPELIGAVTDRTVMLNDSTIVVSGGFGAMTRIPTSGPRMTIRAVEDSMIMRRKTAFYDGHILDDGSLLTHTEHGRWLHRRPDAVETTIPFAHGYWVVRGTNDPDLQAHWNLVPTGFSFMKIDGDSGIITGVRGVRVSLNDMTEAVVRDSLTTYAYREPLGGRLFMGARDVRWTTDAGMTWHATSAGLPSNDSGPLPCISNLLTSNRGTMVLGLRGFGRRVKEDVETDSVPGGIYYSVDDGASWSPATGLQGRDYVHNIVKLPNGDLCAMVSHVTIKLGVIDITLLPMAALIRDNAIVRSKDGGRTWEIVQSTSEAGPFIDIRGTILTTTSGDIVAHLSKTKVVRSTDGGTTWSPEANLPPWLQSIHAIDADASDRLYFFTDHGVFRQSTPTSVDDDIVLQDVSMDVRLIDGALHGSFDTPDVTGTTITIVDLQGRTMRSFAVDGEFMTSISDLTSGLYVVTASGRWGRTSQPVIVVH